MPFQVTSNHGPSAQGMFPTFAVGAPDDTIDRLEYGFAVTSVGWHAWLAGEVPAIGWKNAP